jgi:hypothetical protein
MTITIPAWLLWTVGGIAGLAVLALAALGVLFCYVFKDGIGYKM